jgi:sulfonate transport system substrate-binding protein
METDMFRISRRAWRPSSRFRCWRRCTPYAADPLKEIRLDWATYNPVSMILKQKGLLEKEFAKDGIGSRLGAVGRLQQGARVPQRRFDRFRLHAGSAALVAKINGKPDQVDLRLFAPEWTALVTSKDSKIAKRRRTQGQARRGHPRHRSAHLPGPRAARRRPSEKDITPVLLQHADGKTALIRGDVDAWAGPRSDDGAGRSRGRRQTVLPQADANTWGILNVREQFLKDYPEAARRVLAVYERRANIRWPITTT